MGVSSEAVKDPLVQLPTRPELGAQSSPSSIWTGFRRVLHTESELKGRRFVAGPAWGLTSTCCDRCVEDFESILGLPIHPMGQRPIGQQPRYAGWGDT